MNDLNCKKCDKPTGKHDADVTAVTCSLCSMIDVINELGKLSDEELEAIASTKMGIA